MNVTCIDAKEQSSCHAGYEPHSALPTAMPMAFSEHSPLILPALASLRVLVTSVVSRFNTHSYC